MAIESVGVSDVPKEPSYIEKYTFQFHSFMIFSEYTIAPKGRDRTIEQPILFPPLIQGYMPTY
jgi:hypothetical protein